MGDIQCRWVGGVLLRSFVGRLFASSIESTGGLAKAAWEMLAETVDFGAGGVGVPWGGGGGGGGGLYSSLLF